MLLKKKIHIDHGGLKKTSVREDAAGKSVIFHDNLAIQSLFGAIAEGVIVIDDTGSIVTINSKLEALTGIKNEELIGKNINVIIPERFHEQHMGHLSSYFRNPRERPLGIGLELYLRKKDNSEVPVEISLGFMETESGNLAVGFVTDISVRKKAEDELKTRAENLNAFSYTVAHEINSSLNGIILMSSLINETDNENLTEEQRRYIGNIEITARKLNTIVNELLLFASTKEGDIKMEKIAMHKLITSALDRLVNEIQEKKAVITIQENMPVCLGYGPWVEEVWFNFISNALKYGGIPPVIFIGYTSYENSIKYFVQDNGLGWRDKNLRVQDNKDLKIIPVKGFGLGLSIAQRIIDKLGGQFEIKTEVGIGSTVSFSLPAADVSIHNENKKTGRNLSPVE